MSQEAPSSCSVAQLLPQLMCHNWLPASAIRRPFVSELQVLGVGGRNILVKRCVRKLRGAFLCAGALGPLLRLLAPDFNRTARFWCRCG